MSQTGAGIHADQAEGVLLFVVANDRTEIDQTVHIQGHRIRFCSWTWPNILNRSGKDSIAASPSMDS
jgi:hypothetical protein